MKAFGLLALFFSATAMSGTITLKDYNYPVRDIADDKLSKEDVFEKMDRHQLVRTKDSICSNRAHVWAYDFKRKNIDSVKVFMFFTPKTSYFEGAAWWYHVSPAINEKGKLWVMDAGFPHRVKKPLLVKEWLKEFNGKDSVCKEIKNEDEMLIKLMFGEHSFPEATSAGTYNCYYRIAPAGYWLPSQVAENIQGTLDREQFEENEVMQACRETSTSPMGYMMRRNLSMCRDFISGSQILTSEY